MGSHPRPKVSQRPTSTREKTEEKNPRCATRNNRALLKIPPGRVSTLTSVLSMSSSPLNKPLQQTQDSPPHGLTSWLPLVCSPSQEARLRSSSNKQDLSRNLLPHQHLRLRDKRVKPMLEQTLLLGVSLNTKHLLEHPNNLAVTPVATPAVLPTSPNSSRRSPAACSTSPRSPPGPPSPSSASSSSPPSTWCSPPLCSASPCPPCSQATCSTLPSPSSTPSAPSSSSCPACTSCMFEASPLEILLVGAFGSPAPTQLGTNM